MLSKIDLNGRVVVSLSVQRSAPGPRHEVPVTKSRPTQVPVPLRHCRSCGSISPDTGNNEKTAARVGKPSGAKIPKPCGDIQDQA